MEPVSWGSAAMREEDAARPALLAAVGWSVELRIPAPSARAPTTSAKGFDFRDLRDERCHRNTSLINTVEGCQS